MLKKLEKRCLVSDGTVDLKLNDTRDNYVIKTALGEIGTISISKDGTFIYPSYEYEDGLRTRREGELLRAFEEIFGTKDFEPLSAQYYHMIKEMIKNGKLKNLGYEIQEEPNYDYTDPNELDVFASKKSGRR